MEKSQEICEARTLIALAVGVGFGVIIGAAAYATAYPIFQSEKWAAWVQAVGSVVAVFVAIYIFNLGEKAKRRKERKDAEIDFLMEQFDLWTLSNSIYGLKNSISLSIEKYNANDVLEGDLDFHALNAEVNLNSIIALSKNISWRSFVIHDENLKSTVGSIIRKTKVLFTLEKNLKDSSVYFFNHKDLDNVVALESDVTTLVGHVDRLLKG